MGAKKKYAAAGGGIIALTNTLASSYCSRLSVAEIRPLHYRSLYEVD